MAYFECLLAHTRFRISLCADGWYAERDDRRHGPYAAPQLALDELVEGESPLARERRLRRALPSDIDAWALHR